MENVKKGYVAYADMLRVSATFFVVMLHTAGARLVAPDMESGSFLWAVFYDVLARWAVPVFIMLSGMLFLNRDKKLNVKKLWSKNILRMVTAFVFWSFLYNFYTALTETRNVLLSLKLGLIRIPNGAMHLWFLFVIVGIYIVLPFIKRMCENMTKREAEGFILLSIIFAFLPFTLSTYEVFKPFVLYITKFEINLVLGYIGLFVAGWYIDAFEHKIAFRLLSYAAGICGFLYMLMGTIRFSRLRGYVTDEFMSPKTLSAFLMAFALMMLFKSLFGKREVGGIGKNVLQFFSKHTFGVYLIHEMFLNLTLLFNIYLLPDMPAVGIPLQAGIIFILSMICVRVIMLFPFGKYIS